MKYIKIILALIPLAYCAILLKPILIYIAPVISPILAIGIITTVLIKIIKKNLL